MKSNEYRAAEFAQLAGVNKKTLLYYDEIGLFRPVRVELNGYRVYDLFQLDRLALIIALRDIGVPLKEIRSYLMRTSAAQLDAVLAAQSKELERRLALLERRRAMLAAVREQNREYLRYCGAGAQLLERPAERLTALTDGGKIKKNVVIVNYLTDGLNTGLCVDGDESFFYRHSADGELELPAAKYVCLYEDVGARSDTLLAWATQRRPELEEWAQERSLALGSAMYIETNELAPNEENATSASLRCVRIQVLR